MKVKETKSQEKAWNVPVDHNLDKYVGKNFAPAKTEETRKLRSAIFARKQHRNAPPIK